MDEEMTSIMLARMIADQVIRGKRRLTKADAMALAVGFAACDRQRAENYRARMEVRDG